MRIREFFRYITEKKEEVEKTLKRYVESAEDFYTITGVQYSEMPKVKGKALGFDDLMANIEEFYNTYIALKKEYDDMYIDYLKYINKLKDKRYRLIIEYSFINGEDDKQVCESLREYHNYDYSNNYVRQLKIKAINEFELVLVEYKEEINDLISKFEQNLTLSNNL